MATKARTLLDMQHELAELKRRHGATYRDIANACCISKTTAMEWTRHIEFDQPPPRTELDIVRVGEHVFAPILITIQPHKPPRGRRGRRRTKPHIEDTVYMRNLEMDIRRIKAKK